MNLSKKLVAVCLTFGALPMAVIQVINTRTMDHMVGEKGDSYAVAARDVGEFIDRNLFERYGDVQAFAVNDTAKKRSDWYKPNEADNAITRVMNSYVALYGIYTLTVMVDTEGRVVAANSRDAVGNPVDTSKLYTMNFKDAPWFKAAAAGRVMWTSTMSSAAGWTCRPSRPGRSSRAARRASRSTRVAATPATRCSLAAPTSPSPPPIPTSVSPARR